MLSFIFGGSLRVFVVLSIYIIMVVVVVVNSFFQKNKEFFLGFAHRRRPGGSLYIIRPFLPLPLVIKSSHRLSSFGV